MGNWWSEIFYSEPVDISEKKGRSSRSVVLSQ
jgi:hypothetical protein